MATNYTSAKPLIMKTVKNLLLKRVGIAAVCLLVLMIFAGSTLLKQKPLKVLLITGGCCHNYTMQAKALQQAVAKYAVANWTIINDGGSGTQAVLKFYDDKNWAKGYDVVIHNECYADTRDTAYIKKITSAHFSGVPAVVIHCAMHTYRTAETDDWRQFLGVTSRRHDHQSNYPVTRVAGDHFILKDFPEKWVTPKDELYIIEKVWPQTQVLATSVSEADGKTYPVIWTGKYGKARIFGTTFGHSDDTFNDPVYLNMLSRGVVWAAGRD